MLLKWRPHLYNCTRHKYTRSSQSRSLTVLKWKVLNSSLFTAHTFLKQAVKCHYFLPASRLPRQLRSVAELHTPRKLTAQVQNHLRWGIHGTEREPSPWLLITSPQTLSRHSIPQQNQMQQSLRVIRLATGALQSFACLTIANSRYSQRDNSSSSSNNNNNEIYEMWQLAMHCHLKPLVPPVLLSFNH